MPAIGLETLWEMEQRLKLPEGITDIQRAILDFEHSMRTTPKKLRPNIQAEFHLQRQQEKLDRAIKLFFKSK
ncbi:MAG: hypothetical protein NUV67_03750 [archaeon]|nr:hypothetical protein [archaeon]